MKKFAIISFSLLLVFVLKSCQKDIELVSYTATPYELQIPQGFPQMVIPTDNPMTVEGVALGRKLFYDKRLSQDNSLSCSSCHLQANAFSDPRSFSEGVTGAIGVRNAMALVNLGWEQFFFWDGRSATLEEQAFFPVIDPREMNATWSDVIAKLQADPEYKKMFNQAFSTPGITVDRVTKAIAQFERTLISGNSKFDKVLRGEVSFTPSEANGYDLFTKDKDEFNNISGADCFHCHGPILMSKQVFANNGLNANFIDLGLGAITFNPNDNGRFKAPTLRNIELTGPYMHDSRFSTLDQVINHYSNGLVMSPTIDPLMKFAADGGVGLTPQEKADVKAFLLTLTDWDFVNNPEFSDPN